MSLSRRNFIAGLASLVAASGLAPARLLAAGKKTAANAVAPKAVRKPNIIMFMADDMRYDAMSWAGNPIIKTPNLDTIANQGVVFKNAFVTTSVCPTSRASIYTGDYALRHKVYDFVRGLTNPSRSKTFFLHLRNAGYHTGFVGKWGIARFSPKKIFHYWRAFSGQGVYYPYKNSLHLTDIQTINALRFLKERPKDKPFLLILAYKAAHRPYIPQERFSTLYGDAVYMDGVVDVDKIRASLPPLLQGYFMGRLYTKEGMFRQREETRMYYELITGIDDSVGKIMSYLKEANILDDTNIVFTSDNGMMLGSHGLWGKWFMYEESIRIPLMFMMARNFYPDIKPAHSESTVLNIDFAPTFIEMGNAQKQDMHGTSLMPVLKNPAREVRKGFFYEFQSVAYLPSCTGYRTDEWKYVFYYTNQVKDPSNECLYNLKDDPHEEYNLAADPKHATTLHSMKTLMQEEMERLLKTI